MFYGQCNICGERWELGTASTCKCKEDEDDTQVYKKPWVGLTDEEMDKAMEYWSDKSRSSYGGAESASEEYVDMVSTWRYIEAKLKEKNT